jgi:hypothetical protein
MLNLGLKLKVVTLNAVLLFLAACGHEPQLDLGGYDPYVMRFQEDSIRIGAPVQIVDLIVRTKTLEAGRMGSCIHGEGLTPVVSVNPEIWRSLSEDERQAVFHHELGHCVLLRDHRDDESATGVPLSMMHSRSIDPSLLAINSNYYLKELFLGTDVKPGF